MIQKIHLWVVTVETVMMVKTSALKGKSRIWRNLIFELNIKFMSADFQCTGF